MLKIRIFKQQGLFEFVEESESSVMYRLVGGKVRGLSKRDEGIEWEYVGYPDLEETTIKLPPMDEFIAPVLDVFHENEPSDAIDLSGLSQEELDRMEVEPDTDDVELTDPENDWGPDEKDDGG